MIARLELPGIPKSLNAVGARGKSHFAWSNEKKKWEGMFFIALNQAKVPKGLVYAEATAVLYPPTAHKRDEGNFRTMLEKSLGDVLQMAGYLADDSTEEFRFGRLEFGQPHPKPGLTVVMLECHTTTDTIPTDEPIPDVPPELHKWVCPKCNTRLEVSADTKQPYCANHETSVAMAPAEQT